MQVLRSGRNTRGKEAIFAHCAEGRTSGRKSRSAPKNLYAILFVNLLNNPTSDPLKGPLPCPTFSSLH